MPVVYVDYPGETSLKQIYGTFNRAMLRMIPTLRTFAEPLTNAMVEFYLMSQDRFTQDMQPHYVYSPREMTRYKCGLIFLENVRMEIILEKIIFLCVFRICVAFIDKFSEIVDVLCSDD